ncbi:MAG: NAD(P)-binding domain-containing protein [Candidatus Sumerlaeia bacterium]|nr:NAD(P)-binding domain-containing protein [Candidatus Sumerlaeia bacterium]
MNPPVLSPQIHQSSCRQLRCAIIGAGPTALALAAQLQKIGLQPVLYDRGPIAANIAEYPTFMRFFSTRELLELDGFPMTIVEEKPTRQQYLQYLARFVQEKNLRVHTYTTVTSVERQPNGTFLLRLSHRDATTSTAEFDRVIVACGAWETSNTLHCPGAELPKVHTKFKEPHPYIGSKILVVGGRSGAIETALTLHRTGGIDVSLSYRRTEFNGQGVKYWLKPDIENRLARNEIHGYLGTVVERIEWQTVTLRNLQTNELTTIENDFVLCQLGYAPPVEFLRSMGIALDPATNIPSHNPETLESNIPGLYIAGVILAGNISGQIFIENSRLHGERIANHIAQQTQ